MKHVVCLKSNSPFLTEGKMYIALLSTYSNISDYFISDDSLKQHWHSKYLFRDATNDEITHQK